MTASAAGNLNGTIIGRREITEGHLGIATPLPKYTGFPAWHVLLVMAGYERDAAEKLQRMNVLIYLPTYTKRRRTRAGNNRPRLYPIIGGMLFMPVEMLASLDDHPGVYEFCRLTDLWRCATSGRPICMPKSDIELLRNMESRENLATPNRHHNFRIGQIVRLKDELLGEFWGKGAITALAKDGRIRVEVAKLLGRTTPIWVSSAELVAM